MKRYWLFLFLGSGLLIGVGLFWKSPFLTQPKLAGKWVEVTGGIWQMHPVYKNWVVVKQFDPVLRSTQIRLDSGAEGQMILDHPKTKQNPELTQILVRGEAAFTVVPHGEREGFWIVYADRGDLQLMSGDGAEIVTPPPAQPARVYIAKSPTTYLIKPAKIQAKKVPAVAKGSTESAPARQSLQDTEITSGVEKQSELFQKCYLSYIGRSHSAAPDRVDLRLAFRIDPSGNLDSPKLKSNTRTDDVFNSCVLESMRRARFPRFDGVPIEVQDFPVQLESR